jgi:hypothetical protein
LSSASSNGGGQTPQPSAASLGRASLPTPSAVRKKTKIAASGHKGDLLNSINNLTATGQPFAGFFVNSDATPARRRSIRAWSPKGPDKGRATPRRQKAPPT